MPNLDHDDILNDSLFTTGSNALLAAVVRSASEPIIGMDHHGAILSWNDAAERVFGYEASDMVGRHVNRIIPHDRRQEQEATLAAIRTGERVGSIETRFTTASGEEIAVIMTTSPVLDSAGAIIAASMIIHEPGASSRNSMHMHAAYPAENDAASGQAILVVEDEALIGLGLAAMLENAGFEVIGPVGDVMSASALLDQYDCALAILDIKLRRGETSAPLAQRLKADGIPFFVTSGYLADSHPAIFGEAPSVPKPVRSRSLVAAVQQVLG